MNLYDAWVAGHISADELAQCLPGVWIRDGQDSLPDAHWLQLFQATGYRSDTQPATPPDRIQLYRGSAWEYRRNWSWTDDPNIALAYAYGAIGRRRNAMLWTTLAPAPSLLMARTHQIVTDDGEHHGTYTQYVCDTSGLDIYPVKL